MCDIMSHQIAVLVLAVLNCALTCLVMGWGRAGSGRRAVFLLCLCIYLLSTSFKQVAVRVCVWCCVL